MRGRKRLAALEPADSPTLRACPRGRRGESAQIPPKSALLRRWPIAVSWCRRWESNPHGAYTPRDFESPPAIAHEHHRGAGSDLSALCSDAGPPQNPTATRTPKKSAQIPPKSLAGLLCLALAALPVPVQAGDTAPDPCKLISCGARKRIAGPRAVVWATPTGGLWVFEVPSCHCDGGFAAATAPPDMSTRERTLWASAIAAAAVADLETTRRLERHGLGVEANPVLGAVGPAGRWPLKAAGLAGALFLARELETRGRRRWARVVLGAVVVAWAGAAVHNWRLGR